jgi:hypothetical protein
MALLWHAVSWCQATQSWQVALPWSGLLDPNHCHCDDPPCHH